MFNDRQLEIIISAGKLLTTSGVSGLTIKNLAAEMQFSESAIYRHFTSKEEIILAMLTHLATTMDERFSFVILPDKLPDEQLKKMFYSQYSFFNKHPYFVVAVFSEGLLEQSERINAAILAIMTVKINYLLPIIKKGQHQQLFTNELSSQELTHIIMGAFRLQMFKWRVANFNFDIEKTGAKMLTSILKLIKN